MRGVQPLGTFSRASLVNGGLYILVELDCFTDIQQPNTSGLDFYDDGDLRSTHFAVSPLVLGSRLRR